MRDPGSVDPRLETGPAPHLLGCLAASIRERPPAYSVTLYYKVLARIEQFGRFLSGDRRRDAVDWGWTAAESEGLRGKVRSRRRGLKTESGADRSRGLTPLAGRRQCLTLATGSLCFWDLG